MYVCIYTFQGPLFFGWRGPNAEPPSGGGTAGWGDSRLGQQQQEFINLTLKFKIFFTNWYN